MIALIAVAEFFQSVFHHPEHVQQAQVVSQQRGPIGSSARPARIERTALLATREASAAPALSGNDASTPATQPSQMADGHEELYSGTYKSCMDQAGGITSSMNECISDEIAKQDFSLNARYKVAIATLPVDQQIKLRNDERLWIKQRKIKCDQAVSVDAGGSLASVDFNTCMLSSTAERVQFLDKYQP